MFIKPFVVSIVAFAALAVAGSSSTACNGHSELCARKYSNVTFIGAHDSPFVGDSPSDNQLVPLAEQLALGVRFLQAQTHDYEGIIHLCHADCFLRDAGPLDELLTPVKAFLDANPAEVVTILLTNPDAIKASAYYQAFKRVRLNEYAFALEGKFEGDQWPTLGEMISMGKRLVVFMDHVYPADSIPYIISEFDKNIICTRLINPADCPIDRPAGAGPGDGMLLMNHLLQVNHSGILIPDSCAAIVTNSVKYINRHVKGCQTKWGKTPSFILLDWINVGDAMLVQDIVNGLTPLPSSGQDITVPGKLAG